MPSKRSHKGGGGGGGGGGGNVKARPLAGAAGGMSGGDFSSSSSSSSTTTTHFAQPATPAHISASKTMQLNFSDLPFYVQSAEILDSKRSSLLPPAGHSGPTGIPDSQSLATGGLQNGVATFLQYNQQQLYNSIVSQLQPHVSASSRHLEFQANLLQQQNEVLLQQQLQQHAKAVQIGRPIAEGEIQQQIRAHQQLQLSQLQLAQQRVYMQEQKLTEALKQLQEQTQKQQEDEIRRQSQQQSEGLRQRKQEILQELAQEQARQHQQHMVEQNPQFILPTGKMALPKLPKFSTLRTVGQLDKMALRQHLNANLGGNDGTTPRDHPTTTTTTTTKIGGEAPTVTTGAAEGPAPALRGAPSILKPTLGLTQTFAATGTASASVAGVGSGTGARGKAMSPPPPLDSARGENPSNAAAGLTLDSSYSTYKNYLPPPQNPLTSTKASKVMSGLPYRSKRQTELSKETWEKDHAGLLQVFRTPLDGELQLNPFAAPLTTVRMSSVPGSNGNGAQNLGMHLDESSGSDQSKTAAAAAMNALKGFEMIRTKKRVGGQSGPGLPTLSTYHQQQQNSTPMVMQLINEPRGSTPTSPPPPSSSLLARSSSVESPLLMEETLENTPPNTSGGGGGAGGGEANGETALKIAADAEKLAMTTTAVASQANGFKAPPASSSSLLSPSSREQWAEGTSRSLYPLSTQHFTVPGASFDTAHIKSDGNGNTTNNNSNSNNNTNTTASSSSSSPGTQINNAIGGRKLSARNSKGGNMTVAAASASLMRQQQMLQQQILYMQQQQQGGGYGQVSNGAQGTREKPMSSGYNGMAAYPSSSSSSSGGGLVGSSVSFSKPGRSSFSSALVTPLSSIMGAPVTSGGLDNDSTDSDGDEDDADALATRGPGAKSWSGKESGRKRQQSRGVKSTGGGRRAVSGQAQRLHAPPAEAGLGSNLFAKKVILGEVKRDSQAVAEDDDNYYGPSSSSSSSSGVDKDSGDAVESEAFTMSQSLLHTGILEVGTAEDANPRCRPSMEDKIVVKVGFACDGRSSGAGNAKENAGVHGGGERGGSVERSGGGGGLNGSGFTGGHGQAPSLRNGSVGGGKISWSNSNSNSNNQIGSGPATNANINQNRFGFGGGNPSLKRGLTHTIAGAQTANGAGKNGGGGVVNAFSSSGLFTLPTLHQEDRSGNGKGVGQPAHIMSNNSSHAANDGTHNLLNQAYGVSKLNQTGPRIRLTKQINSIKQQNKQETAYARDQAVTSVLGESSVNPHSSNKLGMSGLEQLSMGVNNLFVGGKHLNSKGQLEDGPPPGEVLAHQHAGYGLGLGPGSDGDGDALLSAKSARKNHLGGFFGVYDGHGGRDAVEFIGKHLHKELGKLIKNYDPAKALEKAFAATDLKMAKDRKFQQCGSTVQVIYIAPQRDGGRILYAANCGDAQAVLAVASSDGATTDRAELEGSGRGGSGDSGGGGADSEPSSWQPVPLSYPHVATDPAEAERVRACGGTVFMGRVGGCLAVSRALGDFEFKKCGVSCVPYQRKVTLTREHKLVILACDGVWDVMTPKEAVNAVAGMKDTKKMAQTLINMSLERGTTDNVSAMVIRLNE